MKANMMESYDLIRHTLNISGLVLLVLAAIAAIMGYSNIALGLLLGGCGGCIKSYLMVHAALSVGSPVKSFLSRFAVIGAVFAGAAYVSMETFAAAAAGLMFVHLVFIWEQVKFSKTEEVQ